MMVTLPTRSLAAAAMTAAIAVILARRARTARSAHPSPSPPTPPPQRTDDVAPMDRIRQRLERGEIDAREYQRLYDLLHEASP